MRFRTTERWDELMWEAAEPIYEAAFPAHGRKKTSLIRSMFQRGLCELHVAYDDPAGELERVGPGQVIFAKSSEGPGEEHHGFQSGTASGGQAVAMALTGRLASSRAVLIDYFAVREDVRGRGAGQRFIEYLSRWTLSQPGLDGIIIEIEADSSPEGSARRAFWQRCGFQLTDYVHTYIWVPEPYQAMVRTLREGSRLPSRGEALFQSITGFHKKAYRG